MATYPSQQAHTNTVVMGSAKLEYSTDGINYTNIGLARGVTWKESFTKAKIQADNAQDIKNAIGDQMVDITFNSLELYLPTYYALRGIDTYTIKSTQRSTDTDVYTTGVVNYGQILYLENQGATSTLAAVSKVKSVSTGNACTTLKSTRDYLVFTDTNNQNRRAVVMLSTAFGGKFSDTQGLRIKYVYGQIGSYTLKSGGLTTLNAKYYRLTNKEIIGGVAKYRYYTVYSGSIEDGLNFAFKSCNEADSVLEIPFTIKAKIDASRSAGDQLFAIEDQAPHV